MTARTKTAGTTFGSLVGLLLTLILVGACGSPTAGEKTLTCDLPDGMGTLIATDVITSAEGWRVMGMITMTLASGDVFTITGPMGIAPEVLCVVGE